MTDFVELVIPIDRDWLLMLDTVALPVIQLLPKTAAYFFTNDSGKVMRLRIEQSVFEKHKNQVYELLLAQLQSDVKVKIYKQLYVLEEARYGKVANHDVHTQMFSSASSIMISLLENAEQIDQYEIRMPYVVIAIHLLLSQMSREEQKDLVLLYLKHWMYFNEQNDYKKLIKDFDEAYKEEVISLRELLSSLDQQRELKSLFLDWERKCKDFVISMNSLEHIAKASHRQKAYYYSDNELEHPRKWEVLADHLHLLMNRFGILNEDETLLMYLTFCAMQED